MNVETDPAYDARCLYSVEDKRSLFDTEKWRYRRQTTDNTTYFLLGALGRPT